MNAPGAGEPLKRAWVLGGGGVIGVAWESGLATGLHEAGVEIADGDIVVGTSAGSIVGVQLLHGRLPADPRLPRTSRQSVDRSRLDMQAIGKIYQLWGAMQVATPAQIAAIGAIVRGLDRSHEAVWVQEVERQIGTADWPDERLLVVAVDTDSGERRAFERADGVPITRAIAASSAVPGLLPAVEIEGKLYMDGQAYSSTHADLLVPLRPAQVLIAAPSNALTGRALGQQADCMRALEVDALRQAGAEVVVRTPSADDVQRIGNNLMDASRAGDAYDVGRETGRAWAEQLR